jgi:hypothetical protein
LLGVEAPIFCLDSRLTDDGGFVSLKHRPPFTPISLRGRVDPRTTLRLEGLDQLKNPLTSGIEVATFRLVAWYQVRYRVPQFSYNMKA